MMKTVKLLQHFTKFSVRNISTSASLLRLSHLTDQDNPALQLENRIGIIGIPLRHGQKRIGVEKGPAALRGASLIERLRESGADVQDFGDVDISQVEGDDPIYRMNIPKTHAINAEKISDAVAQVVSDGRLCIALGGDHSLAFGTIHGHASVHSDVCVIWIDAHPDLNTPLTSPSGNFHGMPNSFLIHDIQEFVPSVNEFSKLRSCIHAEDFVYIGLRSVDPAEKHFLDRYRIKNYSMHDVDAKGIHAVIEETLEYLKPRLTDSGALRPIHLSIDIDSLDPSLVASTGTPVEGGLTLRELLYIAEEVYKTGRLSAVDIVEVNPTIAPDRAADTIEAAVNILTKVAGDKRGGSLPTDLVIKRPEDVGVSSRADEYVEFDED